MAHLEHGHQVEEGDARVQNVLHDQHVLAGQVAVQVFDDLDQAAAGGVAAAVAGHDHEINAAGDAHRPHQVGHKDHGAFQDGNENKVFALIVPADLCAQLPHLGLELFFGDQNVLDIVMHTHDSTSSIVCSSNCKTSVLPVSGARPAAKPVPWTQSTSLPAARSGRPARCRGGIPASFIHLRSSLPTPRPAGWKRSPG